MTDLLRRAGIDPIAADRRPISEILDDCIPEARWAEEKAAGKPYRPAVLLPKLEGGD